MVQCPEDPATTEDTGVGDFFFSFSLFISDVDFAHKSSGFYFGESEQSADEESSRAYLPFGFFLPFSPFSDNLSRLSRRPISMWWTSSTCIGFVDGSNGGGGPFFESNLNAHNAP